MMKMAIVAIFFAQLSFLCRANEVTASDVSEFNSKDLELYESSPLTFSEQLPNLEVGLDQGFNPISKTIKCDKLPLETRNFF